MKLFTITKVLIFVLFTSNLLLSGCSENLNSNNNSNQNLSQENSKLNGGIYLKENLEKHKKTRLGSEYTSKNRNSNLNKATNKKGNLSNQAANTERPVELGPIIHEGWVKYFKFTNEALNVVTPKEFIKNPAFYEQKRYFPNVDFTKANPDGTYDYIKAENFFYLSIFPNYFVFNQSKEVIN
jgi:hypothetical protein